MSEKRRRQPSWSKKELVILRKHPVAEVARLTGRTISAVRTRRILEGVRGNRPRFWSPAEDKLVRTLSVDEAVRRTGRKRFNLLVRRRQLGMPPLKGPQLPPPPPQGSRNNSDCGERLDCRRR